MTLHRACAHTTSTSHAELSKASPALPGNAAEDGDFQAWTLDFQTWKPDSVDYKGVDADMSMKLTSFWFFCNRPTVGALIGLGSDMAAATDTAEKSPPGQAAPDQARDADTTEVQWLMCSLQHDKHLFDGSRKAGYYLQLQKLGEHSRGATADPAGGTMQADGEALEVEEIGRGESGKLLLEGGQQRTVFRLSVQMQRLEAVFNYETGDAPPLGSISVQVKSSTSSHALHKCIFCSVMTCTDNTLLSYKRSHLLSRTPVLIWQCIQTPWSCRPAWATLMPSMPLCQRAIPTERCLVHLHTR
jgi:hypothetical protein